VGASSELGERVGSEHTLGELLQALDRDPRCFSTSALLRPLVQDSLLPTAAYVGGPGELGYFAQLGPLYSAFGLERPLFVLRARFRIVEDKTARALARLGLNPEDAARDPASLAAELAERTSALSPEQLERLLTAGFDQALEGALAKTGTLAAELKTAHEKTRATVHMAAGKLAQKYRDVLARSDDGVLRDLERAQLALHPSGQPQERVYGFPYYAARYGERPLIERLISAIEAGPFDPAVRDLSP
jgi:uncharacterized protein YllA (UPF0747 family)